MLDYKNKYKQFTSSHQFYEGLRMTVAVMVPVLLLAREGFISLSLPIALGAMFTGIADSPGPIHHRRNGMIITMLLLFFTAIITGYCVSYKWLTMVLVVVLPFCFSMIGVYGNRSTSAGLACMLIMVLSIGRPMQPPEVLRNALLILTGGAWYFLLSLGLHRLRPYKLVKQVLGDCMLETARYLRLKGLFYERDANIESIYNSLAEVQVLVHQKQEATRELLFKTRSIIKESTQTGRALLMAFIETVDLFERIMTSQQEYTLLQKHFGQTDLLQAFHQAIQRLAADLESLGIAFQEERYKPVMISSALSVEALEKKFLEVRVATLNDDNANAFISLRHILNSLKDLKNRIEHLHTYSNDDLRLPKSGRSEQELKKFVSRSDYNPRILLNSLNKDANIFRHSVRVSLALLTGFILSLFLPLSHDYWILLTILVILKPAYALTRQRNFQRLGGTIAGGAVAALVLYTIHRTDVLVAIIMVCMIVTYSLIRVNYLVSVIFMTIYIIIAFSFIQSGPVQTVLEDRVVDTAIGSFISFVLIFLIPPKWEHENIRSLCTETLLANHNYFTCVSGIFTGAAVDNQQYKLTRKQAYVALANLGDAFQRMLNEPKRRQERGDYFHQMLVSSHVMISHIATLSAYADQFGVSYALAANEPIIRLTSRQLDEAIQLLEGNLAPTGTEPHEEISEVMQQSEEAGRQASEGTSLRRSFFQTIHDQFEIILKGAVEMREIARKLGAS